MALVGAVLLALGVISFVLVRNSGPGTNRIERLADGSTLELRQVAFSNGFQYHHQSGNRLQRLLAPIAPVLPASIRTRFLSLSSGSMGFGGDGDTNLFVVTVNSSRAPSWWSDLRRLVVFDDQDKIISLTLQISPGLGKRRLKCLRAVDQNGHEAQLVDHRNEDSAEQALLLKPADGAEQLRLTFALERSRFVQFLARPEFVDASATNLTGTRNGAQTE